MEIIKFWIRPQPGRVTNNNKFKPRCQNFDRPRTPRHFSTMNRSFSFLFIISISFLLFSILQTRRESNNSRVGVREILSIIKMIWRNVRQFLDFRRFICRNAIFFLRKFRISRFPTDVPVLEFRNSTRSKLVRRRGRGWGRRKWKGKKNELLNNG